MKNTALSIVKRLHNAGFEAYYAGGCVRDMLMGLTPKDFDIVTSAKPDEIEALMPKTVPIGKQFGVILVIEDGHHFEVATFRSDSALSDGRRPDAVMFTNAEEDAKRRDFTINGMFYDPVNDQVIDYVGGKDDLRSQILRFIGDPDLRIREDYLRILRAVRFKLTYGFDYDPQTLRAIRASAQFITKTSWERIHDEISKMLAFVRAQSGEPPFFTYDIPFEELDRVGLLSFILPEVTNLHAVPQPPEYHAEGDVWVHTMRCLHSLHHDIDEHIVWAVLLHDVGKQTMIKQEGRKITFRGHEEAGVDMSEVILDRLKFKKVEREKIVFLVGSHMQMLNFGRMRDAKRRRWFMDPMFPDLMKVFKADTIGTAPTEMSEYNKLSDQYHAEKDLLLLEPPQPLLTGQDIMQLFGIQPGPQVGDILDFLHDAQLEGLVKDRHAAIDLVGQKLK